MQTGTDITNQEPFAWMHSSRLWIVLAFAVFTAATGLGIAVIPWTTLIVSAVGLLAIVTYIRPAVGAFLCAAVAPMEMLYIDYDPPHRILDDHYYVSAFLVAIVFLVIMTRKFLIKNQTSIWRDRAFYILPVAWVAWAALSGLWTLDRGHWLNLVWAMSAGLMLLVILNEVITTQKDLERLVDFLAILGIGLAVVTLISSYTGLIKEKCHFYSHSFPHISLVRALWMHGERRPSGFGHPAEASSALVFFVLMIIASFQRAGVLKRTFLFFSGLFVLAMMLLVGAKAAVGAMVIGVFYLIVAMPGLRKRAIWNGVLAFLLLILVYVIIGICIKNGNNMTAKAGVAEYSFTVRVGYWNTALTYLLAKDRWIGSGSGGLAAVLDPAMNIHSFYLSVVFELGIIGILIVASFLISGFRRLHRAYRACGNEHLRMILCCMIAASVSILIHGLVDVFQEQLYFWLVVSLVCIVSRISTASTRVYSPDVNR
jgi:hypothetical protein